MSHSLSTQLQELKPLLPKRYQRKLDEQLTDVALWRIKKAFSGYSQPDEVMRKIFRAASRLSKNHLQEVAEAKKIVRGLQNMAAGAE